MLNEINFQVLKALVDSYERQVRKDELSVDGIFLRTLLIAFGCELLSACQGGEE